MAQNEKTKILRMRLLINGKDVNATQQAIKAVEGGYLDIEDAEQKALFVQLAYAKSIQVVSEEALRQAEIARKQTAAIEEQAKAAKELAVAQVSAAEASRKLNVQTRLTTRPVRDIETSLIRISSAFSALGASGTGLRTVGRITGSAEALIRLNTALKASPDAIQEAVKNLTGLNLSLTQLAGLGAASGIALGGLSLALVYLKKVADQGKAALQAAIDSQLLYYQTLQDGTVGEIDEQIRALEAERNARQSLLDDINAGIDAIHEEAQARGAAGLVEPFRNIAEAIGLIELLKQRKAENQEVQKLDTQINALTNARNSEEVQARTEEEAIRRLLEAEVELSHARFQFALDAQKAAGTQSPEQIRDQLHAINLTQAARQEEIAALESQRDALQALGKDATPVEEQIAALREELQQLAIQELNLINTALPLAEARERETQALDELTKVQKARTDFLEDIAKIEEDLAEARLETVESFAEKIKELEEQNQARLDDITGDAQRNARDIRRDAERDEAKAERELTDDIAKLRRLRRDKEEEIERDANERIEDLRQRHKDKLEQIERDYARAERLAILDRDAVALDEARRKRNDALEDADKDLETGIKQQKEAA